MANPRKFSEKIALHNQKQAEETAAFEQIMREVIGATRKPGQNEDSPSFPGQQNAQSCTPNSSSAYLTINEPLGSYRGGSLPNVNQMVMQSGSMGTVGSGIDLQDALSHLENMKRTGGAPSPNRSRGVARSPRNSGAQQRIDVSPYGANNTAYLLSPPLDTNWRRTNSDSAIHQISYGGSACGSSESLLGGANTLSSCAPVGGSVSPHRRSTVNTCSSQEAASQLVGNRINSSGTDSGWEINSRPKSCEISMNYQFNNMQVAGGESLLLNKEGNGNSCGSSSNSPQQQSTLLLQEQSLSNTGSLPDLTNIHFPAPLSVPLDTSLENFDSQQPSSNTGDSSLVSNVAAFNHNFRDEGGGPSRSPHTHRRRAHQSATNLLLRRGTSPSSRHTPPRITVEGLTVDTNALSLECNGGSAWQDSSVYPQQQSFTSTYSSAQQMSPNAYHHRPASNGSVGGDVYSSAPTSPASPQYGTPPTHFGAGPPSPSFYSHDSNGSPQQLNRSSSMLPQPSPGASKIDSHQSYFDGCNEGGQFYNTSSSPDLHFFNSTSSASSNPSSFYEKHTQSIAAISNQVNSTSSYNHHHMHRSPLHNSRMHTASIPDIVLTAPCSDSKMASYIDDSSLVDTCLVPQDFVKECMSQYETLDATDLLAMSTPEELREELGPIDLDSLQILSHPDMSQVISDATEETFRLDRNAPN